MKMAGLSSAFILAAAMSAGASRAQDVQVAQPRPGTSAEASLLSLGDIMGIAQVRHVKLWQAGKAGNWKLAAYEAAKLRDSLFKAALLYENIPVPLIQNADGPLAAASIAAAKGDPKAFTEAFGRLTDACNACHMAGEIGFIRIRTPTSSPYTNQEFTPDKK
jgi:hypothetical protein